MRRMKGLLKAAGLALGLVILLGASAAQADINAGYPMAAAADYNGIGVLIAASFDPNSFTFSDAENISSQLAGLLGLLSGTGASAEILTPSQLKSYGYNTFGALDNLLYYNYQSWGFSAYVYLNIYKANGLSGYGDGKNIAVDVWLADYATLFGTSIPGIPGTDLYVATIETPDIYVTFLGMLQGIL